MYHMKKHIFIFVVSGLRIYGWWRSGSFPRICRKSGVNSCHCPILVLYWETAI